jgi:hypothetical protein
MGGTGALVAGLVDLIAGQGAALRLNAEVSEIVVETGAATGVRLADGETIPAEELEQAACKAIAEGHLVPVVCVSTRKDQGVRELGLIAQDLTAYGNDLEATATLPALLRVLLDAMRVSTAWACSRQKLSSARASSAKLTLWAWQSAQSRSCSVSGIGSAWVAISCGWPALSMSTRTASMPSRLVPDMSPTNSDMCFSRVDLASSRAFESCYHPVAFGGPGR